MKALLKILLLLCVVTCGRVWALDGGGGDSQVVLTQLNMSQQRQEYTPHHSSSTSLNDAIQSAYANRENLELTTRPFSPLQDNLTTIVTGIEQKPGEEIDQQTLRDSLKATTFTRSVQHEQSMQNLQQSSKVMHIVDITRLVSTVRGRLDTQYKQDLQRQLQGARQEALNSRSYWQKNPGTTFALGFATAGITGIGGYLAYQRWLNKKPQAPTPAPAVAQ